jgi:hypothetical protein
MKQYTFKVVITEGSDEGWEEMLEGGATGCDELLVTIKEGLAQIGFEPEVTLIKYEDK